LTKRPAKSVAASKSRLPDRTPSSSGADGVAGTTADGPSRARTDDGGAVTKVIRDSFTMPAIDYARIGVLKDRCIGLGFAIKKSELLRAGLHVLGRISDEDLAQVVAAVESVKTGRPPGKKKRKKSNRAKDKKQ
jgi:hypothetical protein